MAKERKKESVKVLEIRSNADGSYEILMSQFDTKATPVVIGLLEKAKFELLVRDHDEAVMDSLVDSTSKYDA